MMKRLSSRWILIATLVGVLAGVLAPTGLASHNGLRHDFLPPSQVQGKDANLTGKWHDGNALDWGRFDRNSNEDYDAYLRSYAHKSGTLTSSVAYTNRDDTTDCYRMRFDFWDQTETSYGGTIFFTHVTGTSATTYWFTHGSSGTYNEKNVGQMVTSEKTANCPWSGPHTHQYDASTSLGGTTGHGTWSRHTSDFTTDNSWHLNDSTSKWTHRLSW